MPNYASRFNPRRSTRSTMDAGRRVRVSFPTLCSCQQATAYRQNPTAGDPRCKACRGLGWVYGGLVYHTTITFAAASYLRQLQRDGLAAPGDLACGPLPAMPELPDYSRVQLLFDLGEPYGGDILLRGEGSSDTLAHEVVRFDRVAQANPVTGLLTTYSEGVDFAASADRLSIEWLTSNRPVEGSTYAVHYHARYSYLSFGVQELRYQHQARLPARYLLRKEHDVRGRITLAQQDTRLAPVAVPPEAGY